MVLMIPRGAPLSALEKLQQPFQRKVWAAFGFFVVAAILTAVFIKRFTNRRLQILFFDRNSSSPVLQMVVVIFGGSQHKLPRKSFARILLMSFVIICFVFRSSYTGALFKFLQSDGHRKDYETIDELIDAGFTFHMDPGLEHWLKDAKFFHRFAFI